MIQTDVSKLKFSENPYEKTEGYVIYSLLNLDNGKRYIGRTRCPHKRIYQHLIDIKAHRHRNPYINQESGCRFGFEILEENIPFRDRTDKERSYILSYETFDRDKGYNIDDPCLGRSHGGQ